MVSLEKQNIANPWWAKADEFRFFDTDLVEYNRAVVKLARRPFANLRPNNIFILKGPRRVGKTLSMKQLVAELIEKRLTDARNIFYFSFDATVSTKETDNMLREFLNRPYQGSKFLLLDEIQNVNGWDKMLMGMHDAGLLANVVTIATGSVSKMLSETMLGRNVEGNTMMMRQASFGDFVASILNQHMNVPSQPNIGYTFTPKEAKALHDAIQANAITLEEPISEIYTKAEQLSYYTVPLNKLFEVYLRTGGYPTSINAFFHYPKNRIGSTVYEQSADYVYSDAAKIAGSIGDPSRAKSIVQGALQTWGSKTSLSKIGRLAGMNTPTAIRYLDRLEKSYAFITLEGLNKELLPVRLKKIYFSDIFLHYAAGAAYNGTEGSAYTEEVLGSSKVGIIAEEVVACHLIKVKEEDPMKLYGTYLHFYSGAGNEEIDFLYKKENGDTLGIEVKYKTEVDTREARRIQKIKEYVMVTKGLLEKRNGLVCVPACIFLALLKKSKTDL